MIVKQLTGVAVQASSRSKKQATKDVEQSEAKQTVGVADQPLQHKHTSGKQPSHSKPQHQPQDTAGVEDAVSKQWATKNGKKLPQNKPQQRPAKDTLQDTVDKQEAVNEQQKETEVASVVKTSPVKKETEAVEVLTSAVNKVDIMFCFVCLEERYVISNMC